jgi:hypothetical protein
MSPNTLAALVAIAAVLGITAAWWVTKSQLVGKPKARNATVVVLAWTLLAGAFPYLVFILNARPAARRGGMGTLAGLVLGSLPLLILGAPLIALFFIFRHLARYMRDDLKLDELDPGRPPILPGGPEGSKTRPPKDAADRDLPESD